MHVCVHVCVYMHLYFCKKMYMLMQICYFFFSVLCSHVTSSLAYQIKLTICIMAPLVVVPAKQKKIYPHGKSFAGVSQRVSYRLVPHSYFQRCLKWPSPYIDTNASLVKVTEQLAGGNWVQVGYHPLKFFKARGQAAEARKEKRSKKKRNTKRIDNII